MKAIYTTRLFQHSWNRAVADLGFGKGGCPVHQEGAPEGAKPPTCIFGKGSGASPRKFENIDTL